MGFYFSQNKFRHYLKGINKYVTNAKRKINRIKHLNKRII